MLGVRPRDLCVEALRPEEDVVFLRRGPARSFPEDGRAGCARFPETRPSERSKTPLNVEILKYLEVS